MFPDRNKFVFVSLGCGTYKPSDQEKKELQKSNYKPIGYLEYQSTVTPTLSFTPITAAISQLAQMLTYTTNTEKVNALFQDVIKLLKTENHYYRLCPELDRPLSLDAHDKSTLNEYTEKTQDYWRSINTTEKIRECIKLLKSE